MDRLVLFDIDKTLLVGSKFHYNALKNALSEVYGIEDPKPIINMQGMTDLKIICTTLSMENIDLKTIKNGLDECMELMYQNYKITLQKNELTVLDGVNQLLEDLKHHRIPIGLVTGNMQAIAWLKLENVGLDQYFQFGGFGDRVLKRSGLVKNAIKDSQKTLGLIDKKNIFLIGDTPRDIIGGQKCDVNTIGVATGDFSVEELFTAGADYVIEDLKDTRRIMNIILNNSD
jgi:phosphoglycolate phosphatase-like HAD superfamily hydrolase